MRAKKSSGTPEYADKAYVRIPINRGLCEPSIQRLTASPPPPGGFAERMSVPMRTINWITLSESSLAMAASRDESSSWVNSDSAGWTGGTFVSGR